MLRDDLGFSAMRLPEGLIDNGLCLLGKVGAIQRASLQGTIDREFMIPHLCRALLHAKVRVLDLSLLVANLALADVSGPAVQMKQTAGADQNNLCELHVLTLLAMTTQLLNGFSLDDPVSRDGRIVAGAA